MEQEAHTTYRSEQKLCWFRPRIIVQHLVPTVLLFLSQYFTLGRTVGMCVRGRGGEKVIRWFKNSLTIEYYIAKCFTFSSEAVPSLSDGQKHPNRSTALSWTVWDESLSVFNTISAMVSTCTCWDEIRAVSIPTLVIATVYILYPFQNPSNGESELLLLSLLERFHPSNLINSIICLWICTAILFKFVNCKRLM